MATSDVDDFLIAEYNALQESAVSRDQVKSSRVNFFMVVVAAVSAGIAQVLTNPTLSSYHLIVVSAVGIILFLLGFVTLRHNIDDSVAIVIYYRRAGRIRLWFVEKDKRIEPYVPFEYADDKPRMDMPYLGFRGGEAVILITNTIAFCAFALAMLKPETEMIAIIEAIVISVLVWYFQVFYFHRTLKNAEKKVAGSIKFPFDKSAERIKKKSSKP